MPHQITFRTWRFAVGGARGAVLELYGGLDCTSNNAQGLH